jgi:hypothetical protein
MPSDIKSFLTAPPQLTLAGLMLTQAFGWGASLSLLGVLAAPVGTELQLSSTFVYGGATLMFLVGGLTAPLCGKLADKHGGPKLLIAGSLLQALALVALSLATGPLTYAFAWGLFGLFMHAGLATPAYKTVTQAARGSPRRFITVLTLASGLASTIFWPVTSHLDMSVGWRMTSLIYALVALTASLGIHVFLALLLRGASPAAAAPDGDTSPPRVAPAAERRVFYLLALAFLLNGAVDTSMALLIIDLFAKLDVTREAGVLAASLIGIGYLVSRLLSIALGDRVDLVKLAVVSFTLVPLVFLPLLGFAMTGQALPAWLAAATAFLYGLPAGLKAVLRPALPHYLFGSAGFGQRLGRLSRPVDIASALAPVLFGTLLAVSANALLIAAIAVSIAAALAILAIAQIVRR